MQYQQKPPFPVRNAEADGEAWAAFPSRKEAALAGGSGAAGCLALSPFGWRGLCCRRQAESGVRAGHPLGSQRRAARCCQDKERPSLPRTGQRAGTAQSITALMCSKELVLTVLPGPLWISCHGSRSPAAIPRSPLSLQVPGELPYSTLTPLGAVGCVCMHTAAGSYRYSL